MLTYFGFPDNLIKLILSCISNPELSVLLNGNLSDPFYPSRGIRQGLAEPYLFILCMEFLSLSIDNKSCLKIGVLLWWVGAVLGSRMLFFRMILSSLFAKANDTNYEAISRTLNVFCARSGQRVNSSKTKL